MARTAVALFGGLFALVLAAPLAAPQPNPSGDTPGRPEISADSADCLEHAAWSPSVTCTVLYGHIFDLLNAVPINVQFPDAQCPDLARGFTSVPTAEPTFDNNQMDLYSSPGFVEYEEGARHETYCDPYLHPERGLVEDVLLSPGIPLVFYWYLSGDVDELSMVGMDPDVDAGALPCVKVRVTLQSGRTWSQGTVLAQGEAARSVVSANVTPAASPVQDPCAEGDLVEAHHPQVEVAPVHEFPVVLGTLDQPLSRIEGYMLRVEWWQVDGPTGKAAQREWNVHTGSAHRARLVLPVVNPVEVKEVRPQLFLGNIYVHGMVNSPWGSYDVDPDSFATEVLDASGTPVADPAFGEPILVYDTSHRGHFKPVNLTVPWDFLADGLAPGTYTVRMSVQNWQHTATATNEARVVLGEHYRRFPSAIDVYSSDGVQQRNIGGLDGSPRTGPREPNQEGSPALAPAAMFLALVAVAMALRRLR